MALMDALFYLQFLIVVVAGGFIGEYYRLAMSKGLFSRLFVAKVLAGSFLAWLIGYICEIFTKNRPLSFTIAALLSYQEETYISGMARQLIKTVLKIENENKEGDKK